MNEPKELNEQDRFWASVDKDTFIQDYVDQFSPDNPIPSLIRNRDREMMVLAALYCSIAKLDPSEASKSRVNTRRKFLGEWSDDNGPFTEDDVRKMREFMNHLMAQEEDEKDD